MSVLEIKQLKFSVGIREILNIENLNIENGQRIGLVGKNGCGKSLFLSILNHKIEAEISLFKIFGMYSLLPQFKPSSFQLSGGEITQKYLIDILSQSPKLLMLDEPTNNLDQKHIIWLQKQLKRYDGGMIIVSHNRYFLDELCDMIWELDNGKIQQYPGNYSDYLEQKKIEKRTHNKAYEDYKKNKKHLELAILNKRQQANKVSKFPKNKSFSEINAKGAKPHYGKVQKSLFHSMKALDSRLDQLEVVEKPVEDRKITIDVPFVKKYINKPIIKIEKLIGRVGDKVLWEPTTFIVRLGDKIGVIGDNGSGKTTLVKRIIANKDESIYVSSYTKIGYFDQNLEILNEKKTILENVNEGTVQSEVQVRIILDHFGFKKEDLVKRVKILSGGEKVKVALAKLLVGDFNTLILDEPTNHLDVYTIEALEDLLINYCGTVILISHDQRLLEKTVSKVIAIDNKKITIFDGDINAFNRSHQENSKNSFSTKKLLIDMEITKILSQLSMNFSEELEEKYNYLLKLKKELDNI
ncbi:MULTISPECIES: ribosomal protection-like ABC-F family protein [unclassified Granulicatella]|uniref:ribosomal protection-like ABC-F family protein n=1 Tax=unclassified Granulicatella TaxID=2630493 RepID=UPI0010733453|nr:MULTISPECIES: ABC-F family ATP-binding cassette domain-containing protein [unclassified Granulicatella]MBF0780977.1 ABC-F family ATP-binding cassette domain-containing protein [Granulicatella sp. 19428wC4_WM01]TFU92748.1 ABC-F family ATP-binding cassette domain-containing protein [Granulicatella sp. WM01]